MSTELDVEATAPTPVPQDGEEPTRWGALVLILTGTFITVLDYFIANVAVPSIQSDLSATRAQIELVVAGYGVAFTAGLILCGRLGDLYGRRRMYALGLTVFTLASLACGLSTGGDMLVVFRLVQGVGASILVPQVLGLVGVLFTGASRAKAFTVYGLVIGLAGVFGQLIGGALISLNIGDSEWRSVFLINVPVGVVALLFVPRLLPRSERVPNARLDVVGALLVTAVLGLIVGCLVEGREQDWPEWSWIGLVVAAVLAVVAVAHLRRLGRANRGPLLDPALFASRRFSVGVSATFVYFLTLGSFFFLLALFVQEGHGLSPLRSGVLFIALGAGYFGSSLTSVQLAARLGRQLVAIGPATVAIGYALVILTVAEIGSDGSVAWLIPGLIVSGVGMGMTTGPLTNIVLTGVAPEHAASASGAVNTAQEGGAAIGVAIVGTVFFPLLGSAPDVADYPHAFQIALLPLIGFGIVAALLAQLLPRSER